MGRSSVDLIHAFTFIMRRLSRHVGLWESFVEPYIDHRFARQDALPPLINERFWSVQKLLHHTVISLSGSALLQIVTNWLSVICDLIIDMFYCLYYLNFVAFCLVYF
jgi:hypothetical protein